MLMVMLLQAKGTRTAMIVIPTPHITVTHLSTIGEIHTPRAIAHKNTITIDITTMAIRQIWIHEHKDMTARNIITIEGML